MALSDPALNYETTTAAEFRAEAARLGLPADAVEVLPTRDGRLTAAELARFADRRPRRPRSSPRTNASRPTLYADLAGLGLEIGRDVSVVCTFPAVDTRALVPALSHFGADLDAVGIALAETLIGLLPEAPLDLRRAALAAGAARLRAARQPRARGGAGSQRDPGAVPGRGLHAGLDEGDAGDAVLDAWDRSPPSAPAGRSRRARIARAASA